MEEDGAAPAEREAAELARESAGEGSALVAEEFALDKLRGQTGAIDFQKGRIAAGTQLMDDARKIILARAAFAGDEGRRWRGGAFLRELEQTQRRPVCRDPWQPLHGLLEIASPEARVSPIAASRGTRPGSSGISSLAAERHRRSRS